MNFLDKQSMLFTETADTLSKMARETLVVARLPSFQIPAAVEVLTLGTYSRLPSIIREKIVPPDPVSQSEKKATLLRLNQIIQQRLVTSVLPTHMRNLEVINGRVIFRVENEFELTLTVMGDALSMPWRVLKVSILVTDKDAAAGNQLVNPGQLHNIQEFLQQRMYENNRPLVDAYNVLHASCLQIQMNVLHTQAVRLIRERLKEFLWIDDFQTGVKLTTSYWRQNQSGRIAGPGMKLVIQVDSQDSRKPLQVTHIPEIELDNDRHAPATMKSDHLSFERLLIQTTHERSKAHLMKLQKTLSENKIEDTSLSGCPPVLEITLLEPCMLSEKLLISVDTLTGLFMAHVPQFDDCPLTAKFGHVVSEPTKLTSWLQDLRTWILKQRCKKTVEFLPVQVQESLPSLPDTPSVMDGPEPRLFFHFSKHHNHYLMLKINAPANSSEISFGYSFMAVDRVSFDGKKSLSDASNAFENEIPRSFVRVASCVELDTKSLLNKTASIFNETAGKRKGLDTQSSPNKKTKYTGFFIPDLAFIISFCEEKLSYGCLSSELQKKNICHQVRVGPEPSHSHMIELVEFPPRVLYPTSRLRKDLLTSTIRLQGKGNKIWTVSLCFCNCPIQTLAPKESGPRRTVYLMYDFANGSRASAVQMVDELLEDWSAIERLYSVISDFGVVAQQFKQLVDIRSFTYKKLFLSYGPDKSYSVAIHWKSMEKRFQLNFGITGQEAKNSNPHVLVASQIQHEFNEHKSIATLIQTLTTTFEPLQAILQLNSITLLGAITSRPQVPVQSFTVVPQTSTHIRLVYRNVHCLDITIQSDGLISIRDGAFTIFDTTKCEDLTAITGLKGFLNKFVDRNAALLRRPSQADEDNPSSPQENHDIYMFSAQMKTSSPSTDSSLARMHPSLSSNPNTPASPHTSILPQVGYGASPGFIASSPMPGHPSIPTPSPSIPQPSLPEQSPAMFSVNSPANQMHAPSPSFMPTPSPGTHMPSPATAYMPTHEHPVSSPFHGNLHSPAPVGWPGSPSISRPSPRPTTSAQSPGSSQGPPIGQSPQTGQYNVSRGQLTPRFGGAIIPTIMTSGGFLAMCAPGPLLEPSSTGSYSIHQYNSVSQTLSPLERFLGCVYLRGNLSFALRQASKDESFAVIQSQEPGVIQFKSVHHEMQFKITLDQNTMQSLHFNIFPASEQFKNPWTPEDLQTLEKFLEVKVLCAPYKPNAFNSITRLLNVPFEVLKDCIHLMKLELVSNTILSDLLGTI